MERKKERKKKKRKIGIYFDTSLVFLIRKKKHVLSNRVQYWPLPVES